MPMNDISDALLERLENALSRIEAATERLAEGESVGIEQHPRPRLTLVQTEVVDDDA